VLRLAGEAAGIVEGAFARGLVRPFDPRKGYRFLGRSLDRTAEIGDFAVEDMP